jgi:hypothetical protein
VRIHLRVSNLLSFDCCDACSLPDCASLPSTNTRVSLFKLLHYEKETRKKCFGTLYFGHGRCAVPLINYVLGVHDHGLISLGGGAGLIPA